jgi:predicted nucleotidyltransferase
MGAVQTVEWNLKEIISVLSKAFPVIQEVFLFGSRAFKTGSYRSDIDLLIILEKPIAGVRLLEWVEQNYEAVDIFKSLDNKYADSVVNGSHIQAKENLAVEIKAVKLWDKANAFDPTFDDWLQFTREGIRFEQTLAYIPYNLNEAIKDFDNILSENDFPNTNLGIDWAIIGHRLSKKLDIAIEFLSKWNKKNGSFNKVQLTNESDFQNLIELILKPWLPDTERETTAALFDGQKKNIDFSIQMNRILIEAKHIKDANTEAKAVKEIEGIKRFYLANTNVQLLLFFVLLEPGHQFDTALYEKTFTGGNKTTKVITRIFVNKLQ